MFYSYGIIAGLSYTECRRLRPGFILDMFLQRHKYDQAHTVRM